MRLGVEFDLEGQIVDVWGEALGVDISLGRQSDRTVTHLDNHHGVIPAGDVLLDYYIFRDRNSVVDGGGGNRFAGSTGQRPTGGQSFLEDGKALDELLAIATQRLFRNELTGVASIGCGSQDLGVLARQVSLLTAQHLVATEVVCTIELNRWRL
jgi:hypothetical protein